MIVESGEMGGMEWWPEGHLVVVGIERDSGQGGSGRFCGPTLRVGGGMPPMD